MLLLMFTTPAFGVAFVPLLISSSPWVASFAIHGAAIATGMYYSMTSGGTSTVASSGSVSRPTNATWIDLTLPVPAVQTKVVNSNMTAANLATIVSNNPALYPNLKNAISVDTSKKKNYAVGQVVMVGTTKMVITANTLYNQNFIFPGSTLPLEYGNLASGWQYVAVTWQTLGASGGNTVATSYCILNASVSTGTVTPSTTTYPPSQVPVGLSGSSSGGVVSSALQSELDAAYKDSNYVPSFTDATTGLPFTTPPGAATPSQVDSYNKAGIAKDANDAATRSAWLNYSTNKTPANEATYKQAVANAANAALTQAQKTNESTQNSSLASPVMPAPYGDAIVNDFGARFKIFTDSMKSSSLFSLPNRVLGSVPLGGDSVFRISFGRYGSTTLDLANWSSAIAIIRSLVLFVFSIASIRIITLKGGSG